jgi:predicted NAD/FAD-binding protein
VLVTLNPPFPPADDKTFATYAYDHPFMSARSVTAQLRLPEIQNKRGISFAGACGFRNTLSALLTACTGTKYGFHEDGFTSGLRCAIALPDVSCPFPIEAAEHPVVRRHTGLKLLMGALQCIFVMIGVLRASAFGNKTKRE